MTPEQRITESDDMFHALRCGPPWFLSDYRFNQTRHVIEADIAALRVSRIRRIARDDNEIEQELCLLLLDWEQTVKHS